MCVDMCGYVCMSVYVFVYTDVCLYVYVCTQIYICVLLLHTCVTYIYVFIKNIYTCLISRDLFCRTVASSIWCSFYGNTVKRHVTMVNALGVLLRFHW